MKINALEEFDRFCRFIDGLHMGGFVENDFMSKKIQAAIRAELVAASSEWMPIETAPMGAHDDPKTYFIGMRPMGNGRLSVATCYRNQHGAFEWWGGGLTPTYWKHLQPLPAKAISEDKPEHCGHRNGENP